MNILLEAQYLPSIQYLSKFYLYDKVIIDDLEVFEKQSYRNRSIICGANGPIDLIIPVHSSRKRLPIREIEIDNHNNWQHQHWQSIKSAFGKTPFFEHYAHKFELIFNKPYQKLFDFDLDLLIIILKILKIDESKLILTSQTNEIDFVDFKNKIHPKLKFQGIDNDFKIIRYSQAFEEKLGFIPNLSIIDAVFNSGINCLNLFIKYKTL